MKLRSYLLFAIPFLVIGCSGGKSGSGSSSDALSSQFIDDPVVGLNYAGTFGSKGVTGANGSFVCFSWRNCCFQTRN